MRGMRGITGNQQRILRQLASRPGRWFLANEVRGILPRVAGQILRGLYKRGLVDRESPPPRTSARYRISRLGQLEVTSGS